MIIIMTMPCYKSGELIMMAACYEDRNNDESDNNKDKICLLLRK